MSAYPGGMSDTPGPRGLVTPDTARQVAAALQAARLSAPASPGQSPHDELLELGAATIERLLDELAEIDRRWSRQMEILTGTAVAEIDHLRATEVDLPGLQWPTAERLIDEDGAALIVQAGSIDREQIELVADGLDELAQVAYAVSEDALSENIKNEAAVLRSLIKGQR